MTDTDKLGSGLFRHGTCESCSRDTEVAVCGSPFGPVSNATCRECLAKPAVPLSIFRYVYDDVCAGDPTKVAKWVKNWYTWIDGKYVHWENYVYRRKNP